MARLYPPVVYPARAKAWVLGLLAVLLWLAGGLAAFAQTPQRPTSPQATAPKNFSQNTTSIQRKLVAIGDTLRAQEAELAELEETNRSLVEQAQQLEGGLSARQEEHQALLLTLIKTSRAPPEVLLSRLKDPLAQLRASRIIALTIPALAQQSVQLKAQLQQLDALRRQQQLRLRAVILARERLLAQRTSLLALEQQRRQAAQLRPENRGTKDLEALGKASRDMGELLGRLEERRPRAAERTLQQLAALVPPSLGVRLKGGLVQPVSGRIISRYGQIGELGLKDKGIRLASPKGATIVAPAAGRIAFSGPFRGYGRILILEHPGGYHSLLAGVGDIAVEVGNQVAAGEPVGRMPENGKNALYFELRQNNEAINPEEVVLP
jgi:murein hydrolase activator